MTAALKLTDITVAYARHTLSRSGFRNHFMCLGLRGVTR